MNPPSETKLKSQKIDRRLGQLADSLRPGQTLTRVAIADYCDCSHSLIWIIETTAIKKFRRALARRGIYSMESIL